jgi:mannose/fructose/N-acetylgalactosamine-specific phosphotransferase system component IIC
LIDNMLLLGFWGVLVGLDMASVAQTMVSRPLVAGFVAGLIVGDPASGLMIGVVLEFFALEVLPVGAARYPDFGLGAVVAVATAAGSPSVLGTGLGVGVGLIVAYAGGYGAHLVKVANGVDVERHAALLDSGSPDAVYGVQFRGLAREATRAASVMVLGLAMATVVRHVVPITLQGAIYLRIVVVGAAIAAMVSGTVRLTGRRVTMQWFVLGLVGGIVGVFVL